MNPFQPAQIDRTQNIEGWNVKLYFWSRQPHFLLALALAIIGIALVVAWFVQKPFREALGLDNEPAKALQAELAKPKPEMEKVLELMPEAADFGTDQPEAEPWITQSQLSQPDKLVAQAYWASMHDWLVGFEPSADLLYYAHYIRPLRHANELLGDHFAGHDQPDEAITYYRREAKLPDAQKAREKLLGLVIEKRDRKQLREIGGDPAFAGDLKPEHKLYIAAVQHRWAELWMPLRDLQVRLMQPVPVIMAAVAGLVWFLIALQGIQPPSFLSFRVFAPIVAVGLGMLSILPTLVTGLWMEETFGLRHSGELFPDTLFFMLSVGPREELCKLALVLPLIPICMWRKSRLEMLVCAGCVGLGFAIWENLQYFANYGAAVAFPRFLTANFFHLALTGINGLALYDFLAKPGRNSLRFLVALLGTIFAHGLYDVFASVSNVRLLVSGAMLVLVLVSLFFFHMLRTLRDGSTDQCSIAATFAVGISVLIGTVIVLASHQIGMLAALLTLAVTGFGMIMIGAMFYRQLGEGMTAEGSLKRGTIVALCCVLLLPLGALAQITWKSLHPETVDFTAEGKALSAEEKGEIFDELREEHSDRIAARQQKLHRLNEHMAAWYSSMAERRAALTAATPEQLTAFNEEAASYQALHGVTKKEAAELQTLLNKPMFSAGAIADEEYGRYLAALRKHGTFALHKTDREESDTDVE